MITVSWNQFDGGMTNEPRDPREDVQRVIKHFDNYTRSYKLTPYRSLEVDALTEASLDNFRIQKMVVTNTGLFGVGVVSNADAHTQVYVKTTPSDPTAVWTTAPGTSTSGNSVELNIGAVVYHNYIYGVNSGGVWKYGDITTGGSATFTYNDYTTHIPSAPGLVHSKYDIMYWPSGNLLLQNDLHTGAGWSVALTLPTNSTITSICEDNNYLDIACNQADGSSVVYQWDTQTSLNDLSEKIDWGVGSVNLIENIGGILCGISTTSANLTSIMPRVMFKYYDGSRVITFEEFICTFVNINQDKQKFNNLFYFLADMTIDGTVFKGLWKIFKNPQGHMAISFDKLPRNDTVLDATTLKGFIRWGDYTFISYLVPTTGAYTIWRTNDQAVFTATSIYESTINPQIPEGERFNEKQLDGVQLSYEPIPSGGQAILKYRVDGGSWVTIFTETTQGVVYTETTTATAEFTKGREYEFRIESTGGVEITALKYKYEVYPTLI